MDVELTEDIHSNLLPEQIGPVPEASACPATPPSRSSPPSPNLDKFYPDVGPILYKNDASTSSTEWTKTWGTTSFKLL